MVEPITIDTADDPRVAAFRNIRERDLRQRGDTFIAEGRVVLSVLLSQHRFTVEAGLVLDRKLPGLEDLLARWPDAAPLYVAPRDVLDAIAGFHIHRGILALGRRIAAEEPGALLSRLPAEALVVVGIGIANHDNVGAILRNAAAFAADAVLFDATSCDPLYRKAIRVSVGAALSVPFAHAGGAHELLDTLSQAGFTSWGLTPDGAQALATAVPPKRLAIVLGTEGTGLPVSVLQRLDTIRIDMPGEIDSLNVAVAEAIALHHVRVIGKAGLGSAATR